MAVRDDLLEADVIVVGAGPVGLWLAAELRLGGATVTVLEKRIRRSEHSRAHTLHARTLEVFASRGLVGPWLEEGVEIPTTHYAMLSSRLDLSGLASDYPFVLFIPQVRTEELLERHAIATGVRVLRGLEVSDITVTDTGVSATAISPAGQDGDQLELAGRYLVGCDGRRSIVRTASGIGYTGTEDALTCVMGDVRLEDDDVPPALTMHSEGGSFYAVRLDAARYRLVALEHATMSTPREAVLGLDEFRTTVSRLTGRDFGMRDPSWLTRVGSATFQADRYLQGRALLAGDAAHVHFPMGGQGLNLGIQDAMNLGWKLAAVARLAAAPALLDTYEHERAPVGRAVIDDTLAQTGLIAVPGREGQALRGMMTAALAENPALNAKLAVAAAGIDVQYPAAADAHPFVGRRVPNLPLPDGRDVFGLLRPGRFCVVGLSPAALADHLGPEALAELSVTPEGFAAAGQPWDRVGAALIRPDGHLAWAVDRDGSVRPGDARAEGVAGAAGVAVAGGVAGAAGDAVAELLRWLPGLRPAG
jgi:2-polyprenyl-6-methoxyphenol hydroxylase-like FAD-dependent oxidoreductase